MGAASNQSFQVAVLSQCDRSRHSQRFIFRVLCARTHHHQQQQIQHSYSSLASLRFTSIHFTSLHLTWPYLVSNSANLPLGSKLHSRLYKILLYLGVLAHLLGVQRQVSEAPTILLQSRLPMHLLSLLSRRDNALDEPLHDWKNCGVVQTLDLVSLQRVGALCSLQSFFDVFGKPDLSKGRRTAIEERTSEPRNE